MSIDANTRELIADCLSRISAGDTSAAFDLASVFMGHAHEKDIGLNFAVIEGLATLAKARGCKSAEDFLSGQWPDMQAVLRRRWQRAGFVDI
jgi:hypothetical protein